MHEFSFVIVAGGSGSRMGGAQKQFMTLAGRQLWQWSAETAQQCEFVREVILVVPEGTVIDIPGIRITYGGSERAISVLNGLRAASCDYVMVHDAARPFATHKLLQSLADSTGKDYGAVPVLPVSDALKRIDGGNISCVDREGLYITQTPQSFPRELLIEAVRDNPYAKDEAEAWQKAGHELRYVEGERLNFKVTWPEDMMTARALAERYITRTGMGYDVHRLIPGRRLILGGIEIASPLGLLGHSDADILTHAVMDSLLGAAGLPDIGSIFPANDVRYKDADSIELLREVMRRVESEGWEIVFADAVIQAQVPKLNKYRDAITASLSRFFPVSIKFKSAETLDDSGSGLSMTCWAVSTLRRRE